MAIIVFRTSGNPSTAVVLSHQKIDSCATTISTVASTLPQLPINALADPITCKVASQQIQQPEISRFAEASAANTITPAVGIMAKPESFVTKNQDSSSLAVTSPNWMPAGVQIPTESNISTSARNHTDKTKNIYM